jgi:hypothetical protein
MNLLFEPDTVRDFRLLGIMEDVTFDSERLRDSLDDLSAIRDDELTAEMSHAVDMAEAFVRHQLAELAFTFEMAVAASVAAPVSRIAE